MINNQQKRLGTLNVPALGLGCVNLSGLYGNPSIDAAEIVKYSFQEGVNFFDTADAYANGENERLLADAFRKYQIPREKIVLSTKCGVVWNKSDTLSNLVDNSPAYIKKACDDSLKRLKTDYIDLFYLHRIADQGEAIEQSMHALKDLVTAGKIRHIGLSEVNEHVLRRAHLVHPLTAIQSEYSLMTREPEINGILAACRSLNIGFVAYSPLCRGLLSEHFNKTNLVSGDFRHKFPRFRKENLDKNLLLVNQLKDLAIAKNCSIVQLSLAWLLAQGNNIVPIPGTKCIEHLGENINATHIELSPDELVIFDTLFPVGAAEGERYSAAILRTYNLTTAHHE